MRPRLFVRLPQVGIRCLGIVKGVGTPTHPVSLEAGPQVYWLSPEQSTERLRAERWWLVRCAAPGDGRGLIGSGVTKNRLGAVLAKGAGA